MMKPLQATLVDETHLELSQPLAEPVGRRLEVQVSAKDGRAEPLSEVQAVRGRRLREREDAWCQSHLDILRTHAGQWVVVEGEGVLLYGDDPVPLVKEARRLGVRSPYIFFVDDTPPEVVRMGL